MNSPAHRDHHGNRADAAPPGEQGTAKTRKKKRAGRPSSATGGGRPDALKSGLMSNLLVAVFAALITCGQLVTCDSVAVAQGSGVTLSMMWMLLLLAWGLALARGRIQLVPLQRTTWAMIAFLGLITLATIIRLPEINARASLNTLWHWISLGVVFFLGRQLLQTTAQVKAVIIVIGSLAVGLAVQGYYESLYRMPQFRARYFAMNDQQREEVHREMGVYAPPGSPEAYLVRNRIQSLEPTATFALTNSFAGFLAPWTIAWLAVAWLAMRRPTSEEPRKTPPSSAKRRRPKKTLSARRWPIGLSGLCLAFLLAVCVMITKSRAASLAIAAGVLIMVISIGRLHFRLATKLAVGSVLSAIGIYQLVWYLRRLDSGYLQDAAKSATYRMEYWQATWQMIVDHFWFGVGAGNFQSLYSVYKLPQASETIADPHNVFLEVWSTMGTLAFIGWLVVAGCFWMQSIGKSEASLEVIGNSRTDRSGQWIYVGVLVGMVVAVPLSLLAGYAIEPNIVLLCAVTTVLCAASFHRWVGKSESAVDLRWLGRLGLVAAVVNLLAAGGITSYGVGQGVFLLAAIGLFGGSFSAKDPRVNGRWAVGVAILLCTANLLTVYVPVVLAEGRMATALGILSPRGAMEEYQAAARNDPWSAQPWHRMAGLQHKMWLQNATDKNWEAFEETVAEFTNRDPISSRTSDQIAVWYLAAHQETRQAGLLNACAEAFERSAALNPSASIAHARLAVVYDWLGRQRDAEAAARRALELDELNPHIEKALRNQSLFATIPDAPIDVEGQLQGEPLVSRLRKLANAGN